MVAELLYLVNEAIFMGLILFGIYIVAMNMRTFLFPHRTGTIVSLGGVLEEGNSCSSCALMPAEPGRSVIPIDVRLDTGDMCKAEISPCCICIDRMKVGDRVGITSFGSRIIAQKIGRLHMRGA